MEKRQEGPDMRAGSNPMVCAQADLLPTNRRLVFHPEMRTVLLLALEEEDALRFRTFLLPPSATPVFLALLQRYPAHCTYRELFAALYPNSRQGDEHAWERERAMAIPLIRRALKSLLPILRGCGLQALSLRGQGYVLAPLPLAPERSV